MDKHRRAPLVETRKFQFVDLYLLVNRRGLASEFVIDSAATSTEEIGNAIYPPMRAQRRL